MQQLLGAVLSGLEVEELRVLVDELGVHGGVEELVVGQNILEEWDVGLEDKKKRQEEKAINLKLKHRLYEAETIKFLFPISTLI